MLILIFALVLIFLILIIHRLLKKRGVELNWRGVNRHVNNSKIVQWCHEMAFHWHYEDPAMVPKQIMIIFVSAVIIIGFIFILIADFSS